MANLTLGQIPLKIPITPNITEGTFRNGLKTDAIKIPEPLEPVIVTKPIEPLKSPIFSQFGPRGEYYRPYAVRNGSWRGEVYDVEALTVHTPASGGGGGGGTFTPVSDANGDAAPDEPGEGFLMPMLLIGGAALGGYMLFKG